MPSPILHVACRTMCRAPISCRVERCAAHQRGKIPQVTVPGRRPSRFETTHWSLVLAAGGDAAGGSALATLCDTYWYPLYAYVRRQGYDAAAAQDLTQAFFL